MAKPWKAICDFVYCYKHNWHSLKPLEESLRIHREDLPELSDEMVILLTEYYQRQRITRFLKGVKRSLNQP